MNEFKNLNQFFGHFYDERICYDFLAKMRWPNGVVCIHCDHPKVYRYADEKSYRCADCKKMFSVLKGTIFENSPIPLTVWFGAIYLFTSHKASVSSAQMSRHLDVSKTAAWFLHHRVMESCKISHDDKVPEVGTWEIDEVYIGPLKYRLSKTRHYRVKQGTGMIHMQGILAFLKRGENGGPNEIFGMLIPDKADQKIIQPLVKRYVDPLSTVYTDGSGVYVGLHKYFLIHERMNHAKGLYARGTETTNTIEGSFRHFKDTIRGSYKRLTPKHLQRYWDEFCFRYNTKHMTDAERFVHFFKTINRRITYQELIASKPLF